MAYFLRSILIPFAQTGFEPALFNAEVHGRSPDLCINLIKRPSHAKRNGKMRSFVLTYSSGCCTGLSPVSLLKSALKAYLKTDSPHTLIFKFYNNIMITQTKAFVKGKVEIMSFVQIKQERQ